ncbi:MAG: hypothetical protein OJF47_001067 [Nitrospira sp.]|jgi:PAS domain S-box-containing protein|nr:MAG: hypothetical protein OJF47_001067 [Nitrospira sp.]
MEKPTARSTTTVVLFILTGLIFLADLRFASGLATWLPYFFLAVPASRLYSRRVFLIAVGGWSLLIPAKLMVHIPTDDLTTELFNRTLGIIGLWITAYLLHQHRQMGRLRTEDEERMRAMFESALDAVITIDADGIVTTWNRQAEHTFGFSRKEALGSSLSDLIIPPAFREAHLKGLRRVLTKGDGPILSRRIDVTALHKNGREFPIELTVMPLRVERSTSFCAFARDMTERKELETTLRRTREAAESDSRSLHTVASFACSIPVAQGLRLLLAEDSPESQELMRCYFRETPHHVAIVSDGEQAVAAFKASRFDLVLIDLQMPGMDGFTATRMIRAWESTHQRSPTPILALTANALQDAEEQSLAAGCSGILIKPISRRQLLDALIRYGSPAPAPDSRSKGTGTASDLATRIDQNIQRRRPKFLEYRRKDLGAMQEAAARQDYEAIRTMGHRIKGLAGSYGFQDIGAVGQRLEQAARARDLAAIHQEIGTLAAILGQSDRAA